VLFALSCTFYAESAEGKEPLCGAVEIPGCSVAMPLRFGGSRVNVLLMRAAIGGHALLRTPSTR